MHEIKYGNMNINVVICIEFVPNSYSSVAAKFFFSICLSIWFFLVSFLPDRFTQFFVFSLLSWFPPNWSQNANKIENKTIKNEFYERKKETHEMLIRLAPNGITISVNREQKRKKPEGTLVCARRALIRILSTRRQSIDFDYTEWPHSVNGSN